MQQRPGSLFRLFSGHHFQHVKKLKDAGLLEVKKQDRYSYYYVHLGTLHDYLTATKKFENMEQ